MAPTRLPHSRVKRVMKQDREVTAVSNAAVEHMAAATQLFVGHFTSYALVSARSEGRQRLTYRDFSQTAASYDELAFLGRLIPKTVPYEEIKNKRLEAQFNDLPAIPLARGEEELEADVDDQSD